jgi:hypothetical protein
LESTLSSVLLDIFIISSISVADPDNFDADLDPDLASKKKLQSDPDPTFE